MSIYGLESKGERNKTRGNEERRCKRLREVEPFKQIDSYRNNNNNCCFFCLSIISISVYVAVLTHIARCHGGLSVFD